MIDDLVADPHRKPAHLATSLLWGALKERVRPTSPQRGLAVPTYYPPSLAQQRLWLSKNALGEKRVPLLEPGEEVVGTFPAVTNHPHVPLIRRMLANLSGIAIAQALFGLGSLVKYPFHVMAGPPLTMAAVSAVVVLLGFAACHLTKSQRVMFVLTTHGLVQLGVDWLDRPNSVISRSPAPVPKVLLRRGKWENVALGDCAIWVHRSIDPVIAWMAKIANGEEVPQQHQIPGPGGPPIVLERQLDAGTPSGDVSWPGFAPPAIRGGRIVPGGGDAS